MGSLTMLPKPPAPHFSRPVLLGLCPITAITLINLPLNVSPWLVSLLQMWPEQHWVQWGTPTPTLFQAAWGSIAFFAASLLAYLQGQTLPPVSN